MGQLPTVALPCFVGVVVVGVGANKGGGWWWMEYGVWCSIMGAGAGGVVARDGAPTIPTIR